MANGWASEGAVQEQIDSTVNDGIERVRQSIGHGESATECELCGEPIPEARRQALKGVRYCVSCQQKIDKQQQSSSLYNRRGSKDSQLR
ncbi:DksA/TraR family C4-type zinc finger protein [Pantoea brenneri]|uniref:DksA/TraR family C4-type zinc finger protein n=1 Tax=Pantoea brenneri TaxID=472694 RepID=UPI00289C0897|nr:DksA/TraR family C4-type zinc finger protein [Pantoea brenneri]